MVMKCLVKVNSSINLEWNGNDDTFNNESISIYYSENLGSPFSIVK